MIAPPLSPAAWFRLGATTALVAFAAWAWRADSLRGQHLIALRQCRAEAAQQAETFQRALRSATDLANAARIRKEAEYDAARDASDDALADLRERYRALLLRKAATDRSPAASADLPRPARAARGTDGAGADPLLPDRHPTGDATGSDAPLPVNSMVIGMEDAFICADNSARLQAARQWAEKLRD